MSFSTAHVGDLAAALVDDQLDQSTRDLVLLHLGRCPGCRSDVEEQRQLKQRLESLGEPGLPSGLLARLGALSRPPLEPPTSPFDEAPFGDVAPFADIASVSPLDSTLQLARRSSLMRNPQRGRRMLVGAASLLLVGAGTAVAAGGDGQAGAPVGPSTTTFSTSFSTPLGGSQGTARRSTVPLTDPAFSTMTASFSR
jgi:hypothetical protein